MSAAAQQSFLVMASNASAVYQAGRYVARSPSEAIDMAREAYRNSNIGRKLNDTASFRFWVASEGSNPDGN